MLVGTKTSEYPDGAQEGADCQEVGHIGVFGWDSSYYCAYDSFTKAWLGRTEVGLRLNVSPFLSLLCSSGGQKSTHCLCLLQVSFPINPSKFSDLLLGEQEFTQVILGQSSREYRFELVAGKVETWSTELKV